MLRGYASPAIALGSLRAMTREPVQGSFDVNQLTAELKERVETVRAAGAYADDLSGIELEPLPLARNPPVPRVRFRPELGFSSKPVIGPMITLVKRVLLRLQFFVLDDLARQADAAIADVEARLAAEIATRGRIESELESKIRELEDKIQVLEESGPPTKPSS